MTTVAFATVDLTKLPSDLIVSAPKLGAFSFEVAHGGIEAVDEKM